MVTASAGAPVPMAGTAPAEDASNRRHHHSRRLQPRSEEETRRMRQRVAQSFSLPDSTPRGHPRLSGSNETQGD